MARIQSGLGTATRRDMHSAASAFRAARQLHVIPYNAPWYNLLLNGVLLITTADGKKFAVKTGSTPKKHRGWVGFYNSKGRVRTEVVKRHGLDHQNLNLGTLVGMGYLVDSRDLTAEEKFQWYLRANGMSVADFANLFRKHGYDLVDLGKSSPEERVQFLFDLLHSFAGDNQVIAGPMDVGHFYRPDSLIRFVRPIPLSYPAGPVQGTTIPISIQIWRALRELGIYDHIYCQHCKRGVLAKLIARRPVSMLFQCLECDKRFVLHPEGP